MNSHAKQKKSSLAALGLHAQGGREATITGLSVDSRDIKVGTLFTALPGIKVHGGEFIKYALRMGATAILTDAQGAQIAANELAKSTAALIIAENPRSTLALTASLWFGAHPGTIIAVTGTNGKTSVSTFARQIWIEMAIAAVNLGTTGVEGAWTHPLKHTTPEPITLHRTLAQAKANGITHVAMEASSHGLDQCRLDGVVLSAAGFTNFTQDHLDYHKTFKAYFDAKMGLFTRLLPDDGVAVINIDDPNGLEVAKIAQNRGLETITVGRHPDARLKLTGQRFDSTGQEILFDWQRGSHKSRLNLIGGFQADNVLLAVALVIAAGGDPEESFNTLPYLSTVRGRMQHAATRRNGGSVFVDYAHTPDAVITALMSMRRHVMGKLITIIGAGGDRDAGKRLLMGQAAAQNADMIFVTDDNPRSEDPSIIRAAVMTGALEYAVDKSVIEIGDRAEAILRGIDALGPGDALLILGKGHENGQIVGDDVLPFDDVEQASVAVGALDGDL
ncbi:MAG: UDP-N-acetylmuramoyl-L-alanyl-D-glutamate--2,6-diaminopimelate ligase [Octadecabacter sp.]|nr:UDP-N-acetylmuramoyl-L-alanyl-D-glutamate--2,6-diaminopimelate ligase [Octadecabacter sp.]